MLKIGYVEDDTSLGTLLSDQLEEEGWEISWFQNGKEAWDSFSISMPDFFILDVMLPGLDGFELAKRIREKAPNIPILFLTARGETPDRLTGLTLGDDYLPKPFSTKELVLRIKNILNRTESLENPDTSAIFQLGDYRFDPRNFLLQHPESGNRRLTDREGKLLFALCRNGKRVIKRDELLREVWGKDDYFTGRSMDVFISKLRKYLAQDPSVKIQVVHGIGFELVAGQPTKGL